MRRYAIFVAVLAFVMLVPGHIAAHEAPPAAGEFVTPDPAECSVEPRALESLVAITGPPPEPVRTPISLVTPGLQVPEGEPADPTTVAAVTDMIHELVACQNAGNFLRTSAFYTDNVLWYFQSQQPLTEQEKIAQFGGTPVPLPPEQSISVRVSEVSVLPDGELIAAVERRMPVGTATIVYVLIEEGDHYLIDHAMDEVFEPSGTPAV